MLFSLLLVFKLFTNFRAADSIRHRGNFGRQMSRDKGVPSMVSPIMAEFGEREPESDAWGVKSTYTPAKVCLLTKDFV